MKSYSIHKFGGSSLANAEKFTQIPSLLKGNHEIIVVSATQGTTSTLQALLNQAQSGLLYVKALEELAEKHLTLINNLQLNSSKLVVDIQADFCKIKSHLDAIYLEGFYSKDLQNFILGYGEIWSAKILNAYLGQSNKTAYLDASKVLFTDETAGVVCIDWARSKKALNCELKNIHFNQLIITGFIAANGEGKRTILGRNGSDFSAAIFANLVKARQLIIWTDVDGIYTADPNIVPSAQLIDALSYQEAFELANSGAKVLHPMSLAPLVEQQIPLYIKNSYNPKAKGTFISAKGKKSSQRKGSSTIKLAIGLIGPGLVGSCFLQQLQSAFKQLSEKYRINLQVFGVMNSEKMLLSEAPLELKNWQNELKSKGILSYLIDFIQHFSKSGTNSVLIDCTASKQIAGQYLPILQKGIHLITPNKHANAEDLGYYKKLKAESACKPYYFYEATVCAGLPVISTLQNLIKTGDEISEIEGVVSGTLSYIFNEMAKGKSFSAAVLEAKNLGFTEPDPREDLSGMDVARKLVCLAREIGHEASLDQVFIEDLVPPELKSCSLKDFLRHLKNYDEAMEKRLRQATKEGKRLHYIGRIFKDGRIEVAMKSVADSSFASLQGTDNLLIFKTKRYHERPLIIQGPGAGAEVTAAGIFGDLLRLVDILA